MYFSRVCRPIHRPICYRSITDLPATHAVIKQAIEPASSARSATVAMSPRLFGAMGPRPPSCMPIALKFEKPHNAYVAIISERICRESRHDSSSFSISFPGSFISRFPPPTGRWKSLGTRLSFNHSALRAKPATASESDLPGWKQQWTRAKHCGWKRLKPVMPYTSVTYRPTWPLETLVDNQGKQVALVWNQESGRSKSTFSQVM